MARLTSTDQEHQERDAYGDVITAPSEEPVAVHIVQETDVDLINIDEELLALIPRATPAEQTRLEESVREHGIRVPLRLEQGTSRLLDGHRRLAAAGEVGLKSVPAVYEKVDDESSMREGLILAAAAGRELTPGQRLDMAVELLGIERERARQRMAAGGRRRQGMDPCPQADRSEKGLARDLAARRSGLGSGRTLDRGLKVLRHGDDELVAALRAGGISIARAWRQVEAKLHSTSTATASSKAKRNGKESHADHREGGHVAADTQGDEDTSDDSHPPARRRTGRRSRTGAARSSDSGTRPSPDEDPSERKSSGIAQEIDRLRAGLRRLDARLADLRGRKALRDRSLELVQDVGRCLRELGVLDPDDGATR